MRLSVCGCQAVGLSGDRGRLLCPRLSSGFQPSFPPERAGSQLQPSRRQWVEEAHCHSGGSKKETAGIVVSEDDRMCLNVSIFIVAAGSLTAGYTEMTYTHKLLMKMKIIKYTIISFSSVPRFIFLDLLIISKAKWLPLC